MTQTFRFRSIFCSPCTANLLYNLPLMSESIEILIPGRLPSWNALLALGHWERAKLKKSIQAEFLSALRACESDCSTKTTSRRNTMWTAADTLDSYIQTSRVKRKLKLASAKPRRAKRNTLKLK